MVHPPLGPNAAVVHAKLFLFEFQHFLRVVISSANLTRQDWEGLPQVTIFNFIYFIRKQTI